MKILIDTTSLTKGGGQKVGWNFVSCILEHPQPGMEFAFFCANGSIIHESLREKGVKDVYVSPDHTIKRIFWQIVQAPRILSRIKPDVIYCIFGSCIYPRKYCQVCGEAASNLFFPEIDFWCELPRWKKVLKKGKDRYRISMLKRADGIIFENESMLKRCADLYPDVFRRSCFIKPAIRKSEDSATGSSGGSKTAGTPSVLMLCSWQPNKNYAVMPAVIRKLKDSGFPIRFRFSVSPDAANSEAVRFQKLLSRYSAEDSVDYLGTVPPDKIPETYAGSDAVLLLSKLESFSNSIIEAWRYQIPLIVRDMEWSRSIVKDAGYYVDRDDPDQIAHAIRIVCSDEAVRKKIIENGTKELETYPDIPLHVQSVLSFLQRIRNDLKP